MALSKNIGNSNVSATELLMALGAPISEAKSGAAAVLKALSRFGIKPCDQVAYGRGIRFFVSREDAEKAISKAANKRGFTPDFNDCVRRDIRSLARAILDLYARLGETPHPRNNVEKLAEKE